VTWHSFAEGSTLGERGSEGGRIVLDEEHVDGARITLERDAGIVPWAITCGIYGAMVHTRYFSTRDEADTAYVSMKVGLEEVLVNVDYNRVHDFVERFP